MFAAPEDILCCSPKYNELRVVSIALSATSRSVSASYLKCLRKSSAAELFAASVIYAAHVGPSMNELSSSSTNSVNGILKNSYSLTPLLPVLTSFIIFINEESAGSVSACRQLFQYAG